MHCCGRLLRITCGILWGISLISVFLAVGCYPETVPEGKKESVLQDSPTVLVPESPDPPPVNEEGFRLIRDTGAVRNYLLIGVDARSPGEPCRSDAMMLISVNRQKKRIVACSILRDLLVKIPGRGAHRLNSAYAFGGPDLLLETLRKNFNIEVCSYLSVDFAAFSSVIDLLGGVDVTVSEAEISVMNEMCGQAGSGVTKIPLKEGTYRLNGAQALAFVRDRSDASGDFDRTSHQRQVLDAVVRKLRSVSPFELLNLAYEVFPKITSNLSLEEWKDLLVALPDYLKYTTVFTAIPQSGTFSFATVRGMSVIDLDSDANVRFLSEQIYE